MFALFAMVIVTISISWFLAVRFTTRGFESFITIEAIEQTREYAHLLEAQYNLRGEFGNLAEFLVEETGYEIPGTELDDALTMVEAFAMFQWDEIIAAELGISVERYWQELEADSPEEIAERYGSSGDAVVSAIMRWESQQLPAAEWIDESDAVIFLSYVLDEAEIYVEGWDDLYWEDAIFGDWDEEFENPLLYEAPIFVIDTNGNVLFDGSGSDIDLLTQEFDDDIESFPIRDWHDGSTVGFVLSAREPWYYDLEESTFLGQTRSGLLIGGLIAATIALALGALIARQISRPLSALRKSAASLAGGEPIERLLVTNGELGTMSAAFNAMADSLDQQREVRSRMISDLSHELNTPLSVIQLELEALRDGMQSSEEAVEHVLGELNLLRNLATDVGLLAENEAGLLTIQKETIDLSEFLPIATGRWRIQAEAVGIDLRITVPESSLLVEADPTRISQALGNLIRNALQHTQQGGTIEVACARQPVDHLGGIWNTLCVHDSGEGIAPEDLDRVFERLVQAREDRTGRGLGLTIARQIIEAHDGHVWAESTLDVGSSFCIALP